MDENGRLVFENASYFVPENEWAFWTSDAASGAPASMVGVARRNLEAVRDRLSLMDAGSEAVPGIRAIASYGHPAGHVALSVESDGARLLHVSDAVLYPLHLEYSEWTPVFDLLPEQAAESNRRIFDLAAMENVLVFAHHFPPFPNLGHVVEEEIGWRWRPIEENRETG